MSCLYRFEDGTLNFLSILALNHGFDSLQKLGLTMHMISLHCFTMAQYLHRKLMSLHHSNGRRAVRVFCDSDYSDPNTQGGVVNFNMIRSDGSYIGYMEVSFIGDHNVQNRHIHWGRLLLRRYWNIWVFEKKKQHCQEYD